MIQQLLFSELLPSSNPAAAAGIWRRGMLIGKQTCCTRVVAFELKFDQISSTVDPTRAYYVDEAVWSVLSVLLVRGPICAVPAGPNFGCLICLPPKVWTSVQKHLVNVQQHPPIPNGCMDINCSVGRCY
jgi:hypothetical protein